MMTKQQREMLIFQILDKASSEGLPPQIDTGFSCEYLEVYRDLINDGFLAGDVSTGQQHGFADGIYDARITFLGRALLEGMRSEADAKNPGAKTNNIAALIGKHLWPMVSSFIVGALVGWLLHRLK
jgi:hypothetical protein